MAPVPSRCSPSSIIVLVGLLVGGGVSLTGCTPEVPCTRVADLGVEVGEPARYLEALPPGAAPIALLGDTQRTSFQECTIGREVNDSAQVELLGHLGARLPAGVVIVGDLVFDGSDPLHWALFDQRMNALHVAGVPVLGVYGNHEYWAGLDAARPHLEARFPDLVERPFRTLRWGAVRLILLDTNRDQLDDEAWAAQLAFVDAEVAAIDDDNGALGIVWAWHQPPFTNSPWIQGEPAVLEDLVPRVCASAKSLAIVTGHAHGYERFELDEADGCVRSVAVLISGGGGGPRPDALRREDAAERADKFGGPPPRPFHYLWAEQDDVGLTVTPTGMTAAGESIEPVEELRLLFDLDA